MENTDTNNQVIKPTVNNKSWYFIVPAVMLLLLVTSVGSYYLGMNNKKQNNKDENNSPKVTIELTPTPTSPVADTPTPTILPTTQLITATPNPTVSTKVTKTLTLTYADVSENIKFMVDSDAVIEKFNSGTINKISANTEFLLTPEYQITNSGLDKSYAFLLNKSYEDHGHSFSNIVNLSGKSSYLPNLYRVKPYAGKDNFYYTTTLSNSTCSSFNPPCGNINVYKQLTPTTAFAIDATCIAKNEDGYKKCDEIMTTISKN